MRPSTTRRSVSLACGTAAGAVLLSLLTGCGSEGEELSVPGSLCGVKVPQEALKPLLPAKGDSVDVNLRNYKDTFRHCNVGVGRHMVLIASLNRVPEFYDPMSTAAGVYNLEDPKRMPRLPFEKSAGATGSKDSMATVKCGGSGPAYLYLDLSTDPERLEADEQQHRADMRRFTIAYLKGSMKREGCAA